MPFVLDASVAASWVLPDEGRTRANVAYQRLLADIALVPTVWWFEIRNLLVVNEWRGRLDPALTREALTLIAELPIRFDDETREDALLELARRHRLTVYEAAYLELAKRRHIQLATLDKALTRAARAERVSLME